MGVLSALLLDHQDQTKNSVKIGSGFVGRAPVGLTGLTGGFRLLSSSIDLSNPRWNDCAYGELKSSLSKDWVKIRFGFPGKLFQKKLT